MKKVAVLLDFVHVMTKSFVPVFEKMWSQEERFGRVRHWRGDFQRGALWYAMCCFNDLILKANYFFSQKESLLKDIAGLAGGVGETRIWKLTIAKRKLTHKETHSGEMQLEDTVMRDAYGRHVSIWQTKQFISINSVFWAFFIMIFTYLIFVTVATDMSV